VGPPAPFSRSSKNPIAGEPKRKRAAMTSQGTGEERKRRRLHVWKLAIAMAAAAVAMATGETRVSAAGVAAGKVLGQETLTSGGVNFVRNETVYSPTALAVDRSVIPSRLYVADTRNNRVLGWKNAVAFENGAPADVVIGQADFSHAGCRAGGATAGSLCAPNGVAVDAHGHLYVADTGNNRVLEYDSPFAGEVAAKRVFGQNGKFTTNDCNGSGVTATSLCSPDAVAVDATGDLYIADTDNSRVLEYKSPLKNQVPDQVFGQDENFTNSNCNSAGRSPISLCSPGALVTGPEGRLYVADTGNNRVLEFDLPRAETRADRVFGQGGDFSGGDCNRSGLAGNDRLCEPSAVAVDRKGHLYVADTLNNRVVEYDEPLKARRASRVIGQQGSFDSDDCNHSGLGAASLCKPRGMVVRDAALFVADTGNNRVLEYDSPLTSATANRVLGQPTFALGGVNAVDGRGLYAPLSVAIDLSVTPNRVYVADSQNNRVLGWTDVRGFKNGAPAAIVIGQLDFNHSGCNTDGISAKSLCGPTAVAVDPAGRLYVADSGNHRVLEYDSPFTSQAAANRVFGQGGIFTTNDCDKGGVSAASLCLPGGITLDRAGHLYVADTLNNRVLEFASPLKSAIANRALGQLGASLTTNDCNGEGTVSAETMCKPGSVAVDNSGHLFVADGGNSRVLEYNSPLKGETRASRVFGQYGNFLTNDCNRNGIGPATLCHPGGVAVDAKGHLYVADSANSRVLAYDSPLHSTTATRLFGQDGGFATSGCNSNGLSAASLCDSNAVALDGAGHLFVADTGNNRVLRYDSRLSGR
jgi:sugar lactone lactonase YvrE